MCRVSDAGHAGEAKCTVAGVRKPPRNEPAMGERALFRQSHVGRLAAYPMMAIREGMIGLATADSGRSPKHVAPFGGREPRLGTNPSPIPAPSDLQAPFYLDISTSAAAPRAV